MSVSNEKNMNFPNQRPPNSFHHENVLLSDLVINETPKLRTQPRASAWHSRNERLTVHTPAQAELPPQESGDNSTKQGGIPKPQKGVSFSPKKQPSPCSTNKTKKDISKHLTRVLRHGGCHEADGAARWSPVTALLNDAEHNQKLKERWIDVLGRSTDKA